MYAILFYFILFYFILFYFILFEVYWSETDSVHSIFDAHRNTYIHTHSNTYIFIHTHTHTHTHTLMHTHTQCSRLHIDLDEIANEIAHRDCKGSIEISTEKLKTASAQIETARIKKNFKKVKIYYFYFFL